MSDERSPTPQQAAILQARVFALVRACPPGRVTTYGWLAKALGYPRGARMVGWITNEATSAVPAQRVISSQGKLTGSWAFGTSERMRELLESEGVVFEEDGHVDLARFGWDPSRDLSEEERARILEEAARSPGAVKARLLETLRGDPASTLRQSSEDQG
jgi:methylated-DNA-protein-cysteine methyltransferase-like protein